MADTSFAQLPLSQAQLDNLNSLGYREMTAIQAAALPHALAGTDLIAQAKTGSGKTAAFALPLLAKLNPRYFAAQALVLCPTRELADQVAQEIRRLARHQQNIKVVTLCGGQSIGPQIGSLEHGAHIIVGTPGRIRDHLRKATLTLSDVSTVVLDEADRMLEMGFIDDIGTILDSTPAERQTLLFSATFPADIDRLSRRFQRSPRQVKVESAHQRKHIEQRFFLCDKHERDTAVISLLELAQAHAAVVFCNTKQRVNDVCAALCARDISAAPLHGDMDQRDRDQVLIRFRQQSLRVLVATDVAARGLDIDDLPVVINAEIPRQTEVYVHRVGRTGRAGQSGTALSLVTHSERYKLEAIEAYLDCAVEVEAIADIEHRGQPLPPPDYISLCIAGGRKHKVRPGDILGALTGDAGIAGAAVGKINVQDFSSYVAIERAVAKQALNRLRSGKIKGRSFKVRKL